MIKLIEIWEQNHSIDDEKALLKSLKRFKEVEYSWREERLLTALKVRRILTTEQIKQARQLKSIHQKKRLSPETRRAQRKKIRIKQIDRLNRLEERIENLENKKK